MEANSGTKTLLEAIHEEIKNKRKIKVKVTA
jgi:hypothetical protein